MPNTQNPTLWPDLTPGSQSWLNNIRKMQAALTSLMNAQEPAVDTISQTVYEISPGNQYLLVDATQNDVSLTLPSATTKAVYTVKRTDSSGNTVTVIPNAANTIDGGASQSIAALASYSFVSNGMTGWHVIA